MTAFFFLLLLFDPFSTCNSFPIIFKSKFKVNYFGTWRLMTNNLNSALYFFIKTHRNSHEWINLLGLYNVHRSWEYLVNNTCLSVSKFCKKQKTEYFIILFAHCFPAFAAGGMDGAHMSKSWTVTLVAALTTSRWVRRAPACRREAPGSFGVWMSSSWVLPDASPNVFCVYRSSFSRRPPSAKTKTPASFLTCNGSTRNDARTLNGNAKSSRNGTSLSCGPGWKLHVRKPPRSLTKIFHKAWAKEIQRSIRDLPYGLRNYLWRDTTGRQANKLNKTWLNCNIVRSNNIFLV